MDSHDWTTVIISLISTIFVAGVMLGVTKTQTKALKDSIELLWKKFDSHVHTDHNELRTDMHETDIQITRLTTLSEHDINKDKKK